MPLVRISLREGATPEYRMAIADAVHQAMIDAIAIPPKDRFQVTSEYKVEDLRPGLSGGEAIGQDCVRADHAKYREEAGTEACAIQADGRIIGKVARAPAGGPACEFGRGELGELVVWEWGSAIPEGLVRKTTRATNEPPSLQIRVTGESIASSSVGEIRSGPGRRRR
jgi:hypothetical protein